VVTVAGCPVAPQPARLSVERWPGMRWNAGPASRGIVARRAVESAPWEHDPDEVTAVRQGKNRRYWGDLHAAAEQGRLIRILTIKWKRNASGAFVDDQHGATIPVYWREMKATLHEDGHRIVLREPLTGGTK
jgi:hypothetical protein